MVRFMPGKEKRPEETGHGSYKWFGSVEKEFVTNKAGGKKRSRG